MNVDVCMAAALFVSFSYRATSLHGELFIYRINDSPEGVEAAQDGKHVLNGVCNGGQLRAERRDKGVDGGKKERELIKNNSEIPSAENY